MKVVVHVNADFWFVKVVAVLKCGAISDLWLEKEADANGRSFEGKFHPILLYLDS